MTRIFPKAAGALACILGLAACETTPAYPVKEGYVAPPPIQPRYPVRERAALQAARPAPTLIQTAPTPAPETPPPAADTPPAVATPAPAPVESQPLAPTYAPPSPPPAYTPPPLPLPLPLPEERAPAPQTRYREPAPRYIADGKVVEAKGMFRDYVVQKGDHVDAIARDLGSTRQELIAANRLKKPYEIDPGQHLRVPVAKAYEARSGDTMAAVAKRFGVGLGDLASLNNLPERDRLRPGMMIALPASFDDHGPTRLAATVVADSAPRPTPVMRPPPRPRSTIEQPGPYVPSAAALAAGEAHRKAFPPSAAPPGAPAPYARATPAPYPAYSVPRAPQSAPTATAAGVIAAGQGRFLWPVRGEIISGFGVTGIGRRNDGVDIRAPQGTSVHAAAAGDVVYAGNQVPGFGNLVLVKHADGWVSAYAHLETISVQMRQTVLQGQELGLVGVTGGVAEAQLHFEIRYAPTPADKAKPIDPLLVLAKF